MRSPTRAGFAYTGITRGPAFDLALGFEIEALRLTRRLSFEVVGDIDDVDRVDLPVEQPNSSMTGMGLGAGLFYLTDVGIAFAFDAVAYGTLDQTDLVGGGFGAHAYVYPFYQRLQDSVKHRGGLVVSYLASAISLWVFARVDWTDVGNGGTLAFGASFDLTRAFLLPYLDALTGRLRRRD